MCLVVNAQYFLRSFLSWLSVKLNNTNMSVISDILGKIFLTLIMFLYFQTLLLLVHAAPTKVLVHFCFSGCLSYLVAPVICASFLTRCAGGLKTVTSQRHGWQPPGALRFSTAWTHGGRHFSQCSESFFEHDGFNEQSWGVQIGCARVHCCPTLSKETGTDQWARRQVTDSVCKAAKIEKSY